MGVMLHAHYRRTAPNGHKIVMPGPLDPATPNAPWWYDSIAHQAPALRRAGFTAVLLPPATKTISGAAWDADGYGLYDNYDIGSKNQFYSVPTHFGSRDQLMRSVAVMHACGLDVLSDIVLHQYMGGNNGVYRYLGADGVTKNGRYPKDPPCFVGNPPRVPVDPVANTEGNYAFGDMVSYINSTPKGYMLNGLVDAVDWLTRTLGIQGYRIDMTKGTAVSVVHKLLTSKSMANKFAVGEYFEGNPNELNWWVNDSEMKDRCCTFDFTLHWAIQGMCNGADAWNMAQLKGAGFIAKDPYRAVTFVDNPDTDLSPGQNVIWNKMLGYALILTAEGYPCVYYRDYSTDADCYGLKPYIDNLIWIHENLAAGPTITRWGGDPHVYIFERQGAPGLLVALSNSNDSQRRTVGTSFGPNVRLHEYTGKHDDVWTNNYGEVTITIPKNDNGRSYLCFSRTGHDGGFKLNRRATTQTVFGAADLDKPQAQNGKQVDAARIWCDVDTDLTISLTCNRTGWNPVPWPGVGYPLSMVTVYIYGPLPGGDTLVLGSTIQMAASTATVQTTLRVKTAGWHTVRVSGSGLPDTGSPYELQLRYTATQGLAL